MIRIIVAAGALLSLAGCATEAYKPSFTVGGPRLISGMSPPAPYARNSMPQPVNSLPPGAEGISANGAFTPPNYASITFATPRL